MCKQQSQTVGLFFGLCLSDSGPKGCIFNICNRLFVKSCKSCNVTSHNCRGVYLLENEHVTAACSMSMYGLILCMNSVTS